MTLNSPVLTFCGKAEAEKLRNALGPKLLKPQRERKKKGPTHSITELANVKSPQKIFSLCSAELSEQAVLRALSGVIILCRNRGALSQQTLRPPTPRKTMFLL